MLVRDKFNTFKSFVITEGILTDASTFSWMAGFRSRLRSSSWGMWRMVLAMWSTDVPSRLLPHTLTLFRWRNKVARMPCMYIRGFQRSLALKCDVSIFLLSLDSFQCLKELSHLLISHVWVGKIISHAHWIQQCSSPSRKSKEQTRSIVRANHLSKDANNGSLPQTASERRSACLCVYHSPHVISGIETSQDFGKVASSHSAVS